MKYKLGNLEIETQDINEWLDDSDTKMRLRKLANGEANIDEEVKNNLIKSLVSGGLLGGGAGGLYTFLTPKSGQGLWRYLRNILLGGGLGAGGGYGAHQVWKDYLKDIGEIEKSPEEEERLKEESLAELRHNKARTLQRNAKVLEQEGKKLESQGITMGNYEAIEQGRKFQYIAKLLNKGVEQDVTEALKSWDPETVMADVSELSPQWSGVKNKVNAATELLRDLKGVAYSTLKGRKFVPPEDMAIMDALENIRARTRSPGHQPLSFRELAPKWFNRYHPDFMEGKKWSWNPKTYKDVSVPVEVQKAKAVRKVIDKMQNRLGYPTFAGEKVVLRPEEAKAVRKAMDKMQNRLGY